MRALQSLVAASMGLISCIAGAQDGLPSFLGIVDLVQGPFAPGRVVLVDGEANATELPYQVGPDSVVRALPNSNFLIADRMFGRVLVISPDGVLIAEHELPAGNPMRDALAVNRHEVWITRAETNTLTVLDLRTGAFRSGVDLTPILEDEAVADPEMMLRHAGRVFVQVQRLDDGATHSYKQFGSLAVVDARTEALIDAEPGTEGTQAIRLVGQTPRLKMLTTPDRMALMVSASGPLFSFDGAGGLERVGLDSLASEGLVYDEVTFGAVLGGFTTTTGSDGIGIVHTDIIAASHVMGVKTNQPTSAFDLLFEELFVVIESIIYDGRSGLVLMPGQDGTMNYYEPISRTGDRRQVLNYDPPAYISDFALIRKRPVSAAKGGVRINATSAK